VDIAVIGVGHVGLVSAAAFARWGHRVIGMDDDAGKIEVLQGGGVPFVEPGLEELLAEVTGSGALTFTADVGEALAAAEVVFICVGTPNLPGGGPNLAYVEAAGRAVAERATRDVLLVEKSTVPANTGRRLKQVIDRETARLGTVPHVEVASNPEFLREGQAVADTLHPDRIVYGTESEFGLERLRGVYAPVVQAEGIPVVETDVPTAELIKHSSNAYLAMRLSFINAVAAICERVGADVERVADGMGLDARIGRQFLSAGIGYGGSCFPKDVDAFVHLAEQVGYDFQLLEQVREINVASRRAVLDKLRTELWHLDQKTVTLLGMAFKPGTDDLREAPAMHIARALIAEGAVVRGWDPVSAVHVKEQLPEVEMVSDIHAAMAGAHAAVVCTEWDDVKALGPADYLDNLAYPIVIDGRNVHDPDTMIDAGIRYHSTGRRSVAT
jgi:UDPglucose 6-dehydrogenase